MNKNDRTKNEMPAHDIVIKRILSFQDERSESTEPEKQFSLWLQSSLDKWQKKPSISAFIPCDAYFARDISFSDRMLNFFDRWVIDEVIGETSGRILVIEVLANYLNYISADNNPFFYKSSRISNTYRIIDWWFIELFEVFYSLDVDQSLTWASIFLGNKSKYDYLYVPSKMPLQLRLYEIVRNKDAKTKVQRAYFINIYEWATYNTIEKPVQSLFSSIFLHALNSIAGSGQADRLFKLIYALSQSTDEHDPPIEFIENSINERARLFNNESVKDEFIKVLKDKTLQEISPFIEKLSPDEKKQWCESPLLRGAYSDLLTVPDEEMQPEPNIKTGLITGSILFIINKIAAQKGKNIVY